jgi:hypothetical protein
MLSLHYVLSTFFILIKNRLDLLESLSCKEEQEKNSARRKKSWNGEGFLVFREFGTEKDFCCKEGHQSVIFVVQRVWS